MRAYCTLFDRNYLTKALALIESLGRHQPAGYRLYAVCLDEVSRLMLERLANPCVVPIPLHALEERDERLVAARATRTVVEYYWTLTPTVLLWILAQHTELEVLTYLDADLFFFSSPDDAVDEMEDGAALIHRHRFSPEFAHLEAENGTYNVGLVAIRNDARGLEILRWWRDRCLEWCFHRSEDGKMGDQKYLDAWPSLFSGVAVARSAGIGTAPWNYRTGPITAGGDGEPYIAQERIVFFHVQSLATIQPGVVVPAKHLPYRLTLSVLRHCYLPYVCALERGDARLRAIEPTWSFGHANDAMTVNHALLAWRALREPIRAAGLKHAAVELDATWDCYMAPQVEER